MQWKVSLWLEQYGNTPEALKRDACCLDHSWLLLRVKGRLTWKKYICTLQESVHIV